MLNRALLIYYLYVALNELFSEPDLNIILKLFLPIS